MSEEVIARFADLAERDLQPFTVPEVGKLVLVLDIGAGVSRLFQINRAGIGAGIFSDAEGDGPSGLIEDSATAELDTSKLLKPDGSGGVAWVPGSTVAMHDLGGAEHNPDTLAALNSKITDATLDDVTGVRPPAAHAIGGAAHTGSTLANLNSKITDATLDDSGDPRPPTVHGLGGAGHSSTTLAALNALISDATLDDDGAARPPTAHAASHVPGGSDPIATGVPGALNIGDIGVEGVAVTLARSDHEHAFPAPSAPVNVTKLAASAGVSDKAARADHKHDITTAAPVGLDMTPANIEGVSAALARADHKHFMTSGAPFAVGDINDIGLDTTSFVRRDHIHAHGSQSTEGHHALVTSTLAGFQPRSNRAATTDPTVNDDTGDGYAVGSYWVNATADRAYVCLDATVAAAVWRLFGVTAETADVIPRLMVPTTAQASRAAPTVLLEGGMYILDRPAIVDRFVFRITAQAGAPTIAIGLYQAPGGGEGIANLLASVTAFAIGATGNFEATFTEGTVRIEQGVFYLMQGRDSAAGSFSIRAYSVPSLDVLNENLPTTTPRPLTFFHDTSPPTALPATFDPRINTTGDATPASGTNVAMIVRLR